MKFNRCNMGRLIGMIAILILLVFTGCEDLIDAGKPKTQIIGSAVFSSDATASAAVTALYTNMDRGGLSGLTVLTGLSADELVMSISALEEYRQFDANEIVSVNFNIERFWVDAFNRIYTANAILEGVQKSVKLTPSLKDRWIGEAKFFRAFHHFYLVNLFGEIPFITSTDYRVNGLVSRQSVESVYDNIISDLLEARDLLPEEYPPGAGRSRINKWTVSALLARIYLYRQDWGRAEDQATKVINASSFYELKKDTELDKVFLMNSREGIWQVMPAGTEKYIGDGALFSRVGTDIPDLTTDLLSAFEPGDKRKEKWVRTVTFQGQQVNHPCKYKSTNSDTIVTEYYTVFRLAEQFLIRAEARAHQSKLTGTNSAQSDLNVIRNRAGLLPSTETTETGLLQAITNERRVELFVEWGHRWFDLKRTGKADEVLSALKPDWDATDVLYPIPYNELQLNPNMTQNSGY